MPSEPNDRILLAAVAADDQAAYKTLFESYYDRLQRLALLITRSKELSEEIVSDVFIALWRNRSNALDIGNLRVYLYIATRNTAMNYQKKLQKKSVVRLDELDVELTDPYINPELAFITKEMDIRIRAAIDALPPRCKMVFKLVKEDGLSYKEAAEVLGLSVGTIDNQLVIAIKRSHRSFSTGSPRHPENNFLQHLGLGLFLVSLYRPQLLRMEDRFYILITRKFSGTLSEAEGEELDRLLQADPSRQLIMEWFEQMIIQEKQQLPSFEAKEAYVRHWLKYREEISGNLQEEFSKPEDNRFYRNKKRVGAIALAMVCLLGLGYWWMFRDNPQTMQPGVVTSTSWQTQVTQIAEKRKVSLPDGSTVWLNAGSSLRYDAASLTNGERQVFLEGEAFFDIAHNKQRPFRVRSGAMEIKVLGTAFNVKAYPEDANFETSLIRGAVEVRLDDRPDDVYQLRPHEKLVVSKQVLVPAAIQSSPQAGRPVRTITPLVSLKRIALADSGRLVEETAWLQNKLMFRSESFLALAKMLERKYGYHFVFENEETESLEFTGTFTTETIVQALEAMQMVHGFRFRIDKENIYIR